MVLDIRIFFFYLVCFCLVCDLCPQLGKGSQGEVYLAEWRGSMIAVKKIDVRNVEAQILEEFCRYGSFRFFPSQLLQVCSVVVMIVVQSISLCVHLPSSALHKILLSFSRLISIGFPVNPTTCLLTPSSHFVSIFLASLPHRN